jgi:hypothetical protein
MSGESENENADDRIEDLDLDATEAEALKGGADPTTTDGPTVTISSGRTKYPDIVLKRGITSD